MHRLTTGLVLAFMLAVGALLTQAPTTFAQDPGALVITKLVCPPTGPGEEIDPEACTEAVGGVEFFIATPHTDNVEFGTTGGDGLVSFPLEPYVLGPESVVSVGEILEGNPLGEIANYLVACTRNGEALDFQYEQVEVAPGGATLGIQFGVESGDQVACSWYNVPLSTDTGDNGDDDNDTGGPIAELPATGVGAASASQFDGLAYIVAAVSAVIGAMALSLRRRATA